MTTQMNDLELTELFVERRKAADKLAEIDAKIKIEILGRQGSFSAAGVKASYYKPSYNVDYEALARYAKVDQADIDKNTKVKRSTSWLGVCKSIFDGFEELDIVAEFPAFVDEKPARVVVK